jgi:extracellular elastinolytic metalloproteinase
MKGTFVHPTRNKSLTVAAIGATVLAVSMLGLPSQAATSSHSTRTTASRLAGGESSRHTPGNYDVRQLSGTALVKADRRGLSARTQRDSAYYRSLGSQAVVSFDPLTHTPRDLGRLDGFLTGPSSAPARTIAMNYVRSHLGALGLTSADLSTFRLRQDYVDAVGVHNLAWTQSIRGATVFGNGLKVKVTRNGRVLSVQGSPVSGLARLAAAAPSSTRLGAASARAAAAHNVDGTPAPAVVASSRSGTSASTVWSNHDYATRVWFLTPQGLRPGWSTYVQTSAGAYQHVIDAATGRVLYRHSNTEDANGDAYVYDNYPGAARGGKRTVVNFFKRGWLKKHATFLKGSSVTAFADVNDDNAIQSTEKTPVPGTKHHAQFKLHKFGLGASSFCGAWVCTWNPDVAKSWKTNRKEATTNGFYFASNFHDYLAKAPIRFTRAAGNFSRKGKDPVMLNTLDGANTAAGLPDSNHIDNANMSTPPDGISPTMQMYLFHAPGLNDTDEPFVPTTGSLDASVEYHEYTHGLSNRLVIDANGNSTLNSIQSGSMGEAWSDYYAMDYLVTKGFMKDTSKPGQLLEGKYVAANQHLIRTMAIDCPPGATTRGCTSGFDGRKGGYTYADFPNIVGGPEVHGSGEIWGQTLWDLRTRLGHNVADTIITRGMSLAADDPDYLDMRNAILRADLVAYNGAHRDAIWKVFAKRGMGFFAGSLDSTDSTPGEDFHTPPPKTRSHDGTVAGFVTDSQTGDPVVGAVVTVTGQGDLYTTTTNSNGLYEIDGLVAGTYAKVLITKPGFFNTQGPGTAVPFNQFQPPGDFTNYEVTRDWAASSGGAQVLTFDGPDYTPFGCGPGGAIDLSLSTGWGSVTGHVDGQGNAIPTNVFEPKAIVVKLPQAVDIDTFKIDPSATCGDGGSASTGAFKIETSPNGATWTDAATGAFTSDDRGRLNDVAPTGGATNVQYVRFTIEGNQTPDFATSCPNGPYSGCAFTDLTELAVVGTPAP